ncbi:DNA repair protein RecO [Peribacillus alkalitolerans]|uniref:DNA repair protein RecO n=1 Tax=Peribacillus alkalitolerans TaxID=1550385 RepID=UPI0013D4FAF9|nr:DNA repair protein RecO [Peribacillus alkalitolerans]
MLQKCEGIVIRRTDYGENNKIITIYSREMGKVGVMARGANKPNSRLSSVTQLFYYGYFLFQSSTGLGSLNQGESIDSFRHIREDIVATAYASFVVELLDKATEDKKPNPFLFELLYQTLHYIDEGYDPEILAFIFEMKLLPLFGLKPILDHCAVCGATEGEFSFSIKEGGFLCHRCLEKDPYHKKISQQIVRLLRLFYYFDLNRLGNISLKDETKAQLRVILDAYYDEYAGVQLKSKKFLKQMDQLKGLF